MVEPIRGLGTATKDVKDCPIKPYYLVNRKTKSNFMPLKSHSHVIKGY